jgi:hypothetical protein
MTRTWQDHDNKSMAKSMARALHEHDKHDTNMTRAWQEHCKGMAQHGNNTATTWQHMAIALSIQVSIICCHAIAGLLFGSLSINP